MAAKCQEQQPQKQIVTFSSTAMRVNGVLTWLMVDKVPLQGALKGSTGVTSDVNGALGDNLLLP